MNKLFISNKKFRLFLIAVIFSNAGDYIDDIAFAQLVYLITNSTLFSSYVFAIKILFSIFSIFSATLADKLSKKKILVFSCLSQGILIVTLLLAYEYNFLTSPLLMAFVTLQAIFSSFSKPAQNAILPLIVKKEELIEARSLIGISDQLIQIFSYLGAAALISQIGIMGALIFDIISFFTMAILFQLIKIEDTIIPIKSISSFFKNVKEGFIFIKHKQVIIVILLLTFGGNFLVTPLDTLMPAYTSQMQYPATYFSLYMMFIAIGGVIGGTITSRFRKLVPIGFLFSLGYLLGALSLLLLTFRIDIVFFISSICMGLSIAIISILNASIIQILTPKEMSARIFAIFKCISFTASPLGILIAGMLGEIILMNCVYLIYGIMMLILTCISFKYCRINQKEIFSEES